VTTVTNVWGLIRHSDAPGGGPKLQVRPHSPQRVPRPSRGTLSTGVPELREGRWWWYEFKEGDQTEPCLVTLEADASIT
jgi:hypothetical protein